MAGGRPSVQSLTPRDMPLDALICLVRQVLDLASKLRIMALSWKAGEFLDGISKGEGLSDRSFRKKISGELEARYKRNRAEYVGRIKEKNKDDLEEAATNAGVLGCLGGCLGLFTSFDD